MAILHLIGAAQHKMGRHFIHAPVLDNEGKPLKRDQIPQGAQTITTVVFENGKLDTDDVGLARWLKANGYAADVAVEAYDIGRPGTPAVVEHDEEGNETVVQPAQDAPLPGDTADAKKK